MTEELEVLRNCSLGPRTQVPQPEPQPFIEYLLLVTLW